MEFFVQIDAHDVMNGIDGNFHSPARDFEKLPATSGDLLLYLGVGICHRSGGKFVVHQTNQGIITMKFDDFVPGITLGIQPAWYPFLKDRILSTCADASYGAGQALRVVESVSYMSAKARIRNVKMPWANEIAFVVKIIAEGPTSFSDARVLHDRILKGDY
ncbi:hypothetical protein A2929_02565 [Candidatus Kaiserbacteria bacterium RIFCSPLOWO2_01_FULL_45_25]|uniref:Uncharacterized protein n=1 Tax=Candidatus Kaiserbacteria bacterium RIFCSPLOWO2_12_FULL_45_26 TaxID=1798525 RepID=A0A1F6FH30_9BACT|nr:MAG: hypothetical protein A2Z56_04465 [Candidatus Kaiserbacteria bacterium RIFCSPHIGHO2_12_45_16]OGG69796.1 MAG: hypothetical protein A2929_02565 [Candidatus Kaiserbacteria bacterium RIFCSPLOWO2_01_FULL_45_25]OGG85162.1 MAG: hypothetical protein A3G90_03845 [Candidatus Kaiserbacteria bacterium RIFCSPLOWO2_12_FULL_45_26]